MLLALLTMLIIDVKELHAWSTGRDLIFNKLGEYAENVGYHLKFFDQQFFHAGFKQYFVTKTINPEWFFSRKLCQDFGMELARLELAAEADYILTQLASYTGETGGINLNVDGTTLTPGTTGWSWVCSNYPIDYTIKCAPNYPDGGAQICLAVSRNNAGITGFSDFTCGGSGANRRVLCQIKHENIVHRIINSQGK